MQSPSTSIYNEAHKSGQYVPTISGTMHDEKSTQGGAELTKRVIKVLIFCTSKFGGYDY